MPRKPISRNRRRRGNRRSRTRALVVVLIVAFVAAPIVAISLGGSTSPAKVNTPATTTPATTTPATTTPATTATTVPAGPPAPIDIAAARACAAFTTYLDDASQGKVPQAAGRTLTDDAYQLLAGASQDQTAGKPLPKWISLGEYLLAAADDVVNRDTSALSTDGTAAAQACQSIPAPARAAGGYTPTSTPTASPTSTSTTS